jgi:hypothetical protein
MSILTDDDLITLMQIKIFLDEDLTDSAFRASLLKRYITLSRWLDAEDLVRMQRLAGVVPIVPRLCKCTNCKKSQVSIDLICGSCYSVMIQILEGNDDF